MLLFCLLIVVVTCGFFVVYFWTGMLCVWAACPRAILSTSSPVSSRVCSSVCFVCQFDPLFYINSDLLYLLPWIRLTDTQGHESVADPPSRDGRLDWPQLSPLPAVALSLCLYFLLFHDSSEEQLQMSQAILYKRGTVMSLLLKCLGVCQDCMHEINIK